MDKREDKIKKADNGKYYLPKGKYVIKISANGKVAKKDFEVK